MTGEPIVEADIAASFQQAVVDVLVIMPSVRPKIPYGPSGYRRHRRCIEQYSAWRWKQHVKEGIRLPSVPSSVPTINVAMTVAAYYEPEGTRHGWSNANEPEAWRTIKKLPQQNGEERSAASFAFVENGGKDEKEK